MAFIVAFYVPSSVEGITSTPHSNLHDMSEF